MYINDFLFKTNDGGFLDLNTMSSGQKMLLIRLLTILNEIRPGALVIIEEPELHLDPAWSRQLISLLLRFFKNVNAHLIIATHSFSLLNAVPSDCVLLAKSGEFLKPETATLLANESALATAFFKVKPHEVEERIMEFSAKASLNQLRKLFNLLGESSARYEVFLRITELTQKSH